MVVVFLHEVRAGQFKPRHLVTTINGKVISDVVLTNPVYVTWETASRVTTNGIEYYHHPVTNLLWHQWAIFK
jgi:hypothetical protein